MCSTDSRTDRSQLDSADLRWKDRVAKSFGAASDSYEQHAIVQRRVALFLLELAQELVDFDSIGAGLEIGCGTGYLTREVLEQLDNVQWTITDVSPEMLNHCRNHPFTLPWVKPDTVFEVVDGELLGESGLGDRQFDIIVSNMTFQWFADLPSAVRQLMKAIRPGGWLFFSIPSVNNFDHVTKKYPFLKDKLNDAFGYEQMSELFESIEGVELQRAAHITNRPYQNLGEFLKALKLIGANVVRQPSLESKLSELKKAIHESNDEEQLLVNYQTSLLAAHKKKVAR